MYSLDERIFLALNFDGGKTMDSVMETVSSTAVWIPFYIFICWLVYRKFGWRSVVTFLVCMVLAIGLSDMFCGIFKHSGLLKNLWASFPARPRPMFTPGIDQVCHVPSYAHGPYGTVSAHAATLFSLSFIACLAIRRWWFTILCFLVALLICYSRIYLACHFPKDIMLGAAVGTIAGIGMYLVWKKLDHTIEIYRK